MSTRYPYMRSYSYLKYVLGCHIGDQISPSVLTSHTSLWKQVRYTRDARQITDPENRRRILVAFDRTVSQMILTSSHLSRALHTLLLSSFKIEQFVIVCIRNCKARFNCITGGT